MTRKGWNVGDVRHVATGPTEKGLQVMIMRAEGEGGRKAIAALDGEGNSVLSVQVIEGNELTGFPVHGRVFYVHPDVAEQGVGGAVTAHAIAEAFSSGLNEVSMQNFANKRWKRHLLEHLGFEPEPEDRIRLAAGASEKWRKFLVGRQR